MRHAALQEIPRWRCSFIAETPFVLGHEVQGLEPHRQRQLGGVEDGPCGHRGPAMAAMALLELAAGQLAVAVMATVRTHEAIGPSPLVHCTPKEPHWIHWPYGINKPVDNYSVEQARIPHRTAPPIRQLDDWGTSDFRMAGRNDSAGCFTSLRRLRRVRLPPPRPAGAGASTPRTPPPECRPPPRSRDRDGRAPPARRRRAPYGPPGR